MLCPVCKNSYPGDLINDHIDKCIAAIYQPYPHPLRFSVKREFPFKEAEMASKSKKYKSDPAESTSATFLQGNSSIKSNISLAERMRPKCLNDYVGQKQVIGPNMVLRQLLSNGQIPSIILWGPPGCGKTSLTNVISCIGKNLLSDKIHIIKLSAVSSGVNTIREAVNTAKEKAKVNKKTILFMDEIHRFNKLQQDIFLPHVEAGTITLIGTTTENPSYSLNSALLSRCRVFGLKKLTVQDITSILIKAINLINGEVIDLEDDSKDRNKCEPSFAINQNVIDWLAEVCDGDARVALNGLELAVKSKVSNSKSKAISVLNLNDVKESLKQVHTLSDSQTNNTHHIYSALWKSIQAGNANASLYWLARVMAIKEDPVNIARRLVRISSEDIGLADPDALGIAVHTMHGCQMIGMPEADVLLGQCVVYLTRAPKSRLMYNALKAAEDIIINHEGPQPNVPLQIRCRSGEGKLQASLGRNRSSLLRIEEETRRYLPSGLEHLNLFHAADGPIRKRL